MSAVEWTEQDQRDWERLQAVTAVNRVHNLAKMDEAGVLRRARRGFHEATQSNLYRIQSIERNERSVRTRKGEEYRYVVVVAFADDSYSTRYGYIVGPRGKATKAY